MEVELNYLVGYNNTINSYISSGYTLEEAIRLAEEEDALDSIFDEVGRDESN